MINDIFNVMKQQSQLNMSNLAYTKLGTIASFDPNTYRAIVKIEPADENGENILTGWLPVLMPWVGNEWGMFAPPESGNSCIVNFIDASFNNGIVCLNYFNNNYRPIPVQSGEFWLVHKSGSFLKLKNDGSIEVNGNSKIVVNSPEVEIGDISGGNLKKLLNELAREIFNTHTHTDSEGGATTSPIQQMDETTLTESTEAN